jgi:DTW domain-containing protein YfiP
VCKYSASYFVYTFCNNWHPLFIYIPCGLEAARKISRINPRFQSLPVLLAKVTTGILRIFRFYA